MRNQVVLVTGANTGIGKYTALELAKLNATVIMAGRDKKRIDAAVADVKTAIPYADVRSEIIDLADLNSVLAFSKRFTASYKRLDRLILNAGVMIPPYTKTAQGFELQWGTNHIGHHLLTRELLPLVKATPQSRIISVSSMGHANAKVEATIADPTWSSRPYNAFQAYADSKHANVLMALHAQTLLKEAGSDALALSNHPGVIDTELARHLPYHDTIKPFTKPLTYIFMKNAWQGAQTQLYLTTALHEVLKPHAGAYFADCAVMNVNTTMGYVLPYGRVASHPAQLDTALAAKLWSATEAEIARVM
jgi:NAD(P)-dependent dehydrogenase (short-subunit alcohol dehydrogenase family)